MLLLGVSKSRPAEVDSGRGPVRFQKYRHIQEHSLLERARPFGRPNMIRLVSIAMAMTVACLGMARQAMIAEVCREDRGP